LRCLLLVASCFVLCCCFASCCFLLCLVVCGASLRWLASCFLLLASCFLLLASCFLLLAWLRFAGLLRFVLLS
jgi:hypothetical protein